MSDQVLIQFRADKALKQEVAQIYETIGLDLPTAFRMFLLRSKLERGLPFPATADSARMTRKQALETLDVLRDQASALPDMSLEEINAEIKAARQERKRKRA